MNFLIIAVVMLFSTSVIADDTSARDAYNNATLLFENGEYDKASAEFQKAYKLMPSWKIRFNIGQCEAAAKRYGLALEAFEAYLVEGGDELGQEREEIVAKEISLLKSKLGSVTLSAPEGSDVFVNGISRGTTPLPGKLRISASIVHTLAVSKNGDILLERKIQLGSGESIEIKVGDDSDAVNSVEAPPEKQTVAASDAAKTSKEQPVAKQPTPPLEKRGLKISGLVLLGVGAAALVGGSVTGGMAISKNNDLKESCDKDTLNCDDALEPTRNEAKTMGTLSTILFASGATLAVTGAVLLIVKRNKQMEMAGISFTPVVSSAFAGAIVQGKF